MSLSASHQADEAAGRAATTLTRQRHGLPPDGIVESSCWVRPRCATLPQCDSIDWRAKVSHRGLDNNAAAAEPSRSIARARTDLATRRPRRPQSPPANMSDTACFRLAGTGRLSRPPGTFAATSRDAGGTSRRALVEGFLKPGHRLPGAVPDPGSECV
jgi:hypothetical protein